MFLFMILLFPTVLGFCAAHSDKKIYGFMIALGAVSGIAVCACSAVFSYMHRIPQYSLVINFFYYFLKIYALPLLLLYAAYFFVTKDSFDFRVKAFFPVVASFYAIYMPYCIIAASDASFSFFLLFVKPVVMLSMVFLSSLIAYRIYCRALENSVSRIVLLGFCEFFVLALPALLEALWLMCLMLPVVYIAAVIYALVALILFFISSRGRSDFLF